MKRLLAAATAVAVVGGCGSERPQHRGLVWKGRPLLVRSGGLSKDRVVIGTVRNDSSHALSLTASKLAVRDAGGRRLRSYARFTNTYAHGLYGAYQKPTPLPPQELRRLGYVATIAPGKSAPLFVAFRLTAHARGPLHVDYGKGSLPVPRRASSATP